MGTVPPFNQIAHLLTAQPTEPVTFETNGQRHASVAMILEQPTDGPHRMLMIQRASDSQDPWSGHLAFPGGRVEPGEHLSATAERETWEEVGLVIGESQRLGKLDDIVGTNLPVVVSCFVYGFSVPVPPLQINHEVHDAFWVSIADLTDPDRHIITEVSFGTRSLRVPAIQLGLVGKPVLWGITYRLVTQFLQRTGIGLGTF